MTTEHADLVARLGAGVNRRDDSGEPIEELGYSIGWWNGNPDSKSAVDLSVALGVTSTWVRNRVVIHLPDLRAAPELYITTKALEILHALIGVFAPDSAVWTNHSLIAPQKEPNEPLENGGYKLGRVNGVPVGWANYLRDGILPAFAVAQLPTRAVVEHVGNGTLVHVGDNPADPVLDDVLQIRRAMGYRPTERRAGLKTQEDSAS